MKAEIEPYARLFNTVLKWQKAEKKWMDGAFLDLNSLQIRSDIAEFSREMVKLQKLFKSKFKQAALDGESKYSKMNLEDTDPDQLPPPLKICALTIAAINKFTENIRVVTCLCNPGIRQRHWTQMSNIIGYDITPNSGSSLRKVLRLALDQFMDRLEEVSTAATKEHALELELLEMMAKWDDICFETTSYRDSTIKILGSVELIEAHLGKWSTHIP
jgi:dynein heavy chain